MFFRTQLTEQDWQDATPPQKHLNDRIVRLPRGKVFGGCSSTNATVYVRGHPENFNGWARDGCEGWSYDEVLPFFKKAENCRYGVLWPMCACVCVLLLHPLGHFLLSCSSSGAQCCVRYMLSRCV
mgnify:CR=1 FL=1